MTSGIYKLEFNSGHVYIGKSVDIETRYQQHLDKLVKGTAAKNMQYAYNIYGAPEISVLIEARPDHLDFLEYIHITQHRASYGPDCLNSSTPYLDYEISQENIDLMDEYPYLLDMTTFDHMHKIVELEAQLSDVQWEYQKEQATMSDEVERWKHLNITAEMKDMIASLEQAKEYSVCLHKQLEDSKLELIKEKEKSWWKKVMGV